MQENHKVEIIQANRMLQAKVGTGTIDENVVQKCQMIMENNDVDFAPMAMDYLDELGEAIKYAATADADMKQAVDSMTGPVMQLKANSKTFQYEMVGNMANIMLSFLEAIKKLDNDVLEIVKAHHTTLVAIVTKQMKGDGGAYGVQLEKELKDACKRYFVKRRG